MQIEIKGSSLPDTIARKQALETINNHATTEVLQFLAELSEKPNVNEKLLKNKFIIKNFI